MEIIDSYQQDIASIKQALGVSSLRQAMHQDAATVDKLLEGMEEGSEAVRSAVASHLGNYVDVLV
ncbi:hypothetical protein [Halocella sp. SP3-1]|uniref:hypothetical protein n=1 Tax=Halocella sp. SP3-1 TaxID=2382161 RepID=UPI000F760305|nr:hypothetical protein [Halocella sp. SP3-1]AZO94030.1 hypothetical protein D7D81_05180 [Halocella sp. SP3-1]